MGGCERGNKTRRSKVTVQLKGQQPISITVNKSVQVNMAVGAYVKANVHSLVLLTQLQDNYVRRYVQKLLVPMLLID